MNTPKHESFSQMCAISMPYQFSLSVQIAGGGNLSKKRDMWCPQTEVLKRLTECRSNIAIQTNETSVLLPRREERRNQGILTRRKVSF